MALVLKDRVKETTTTTGTADFTLGGAATGFQSFSVIGNGNTTYYAAVDPTTGDWEVGVGTYSTTGPTLTRDSVLESSNAGSKVVFAAGSKDVFCTYPAERSVNLDAAGSAVTILDIGTLGVSTANISTANITSGTVSTTPTSSTDIANKTYVDTQVSSGITYHSPVKYEVPNTTGNLTATYNQPGGSGVGVGATLTNAGTLAAFAPDGPTAQVGDRILVYNQTNAFENGVYTVTTVGSGAVAWVLTRATDADTYAIKSPNGLGLGDAFFVTSGDTGAGETYVCNTSGIITFGTTNIAFVQISSAQVYSAGTGLNLSPATTFNISNTGVTASTYGSGSNVPVFAVNAQGQITSVTNTAIAISAGAVSGLAASATTDTTDATNITSGTLPSGRLNGSYTGVTGVGTLTAGTWNGSTIAAAYGGTGLSSYAVGDLIYADTTTSLAKLADVVSGNVLLSGGVGTAPAWGQVGLQTHVTGTLQVTNGGTGATTLTGYIKGNGTSAFTASASIPNSDTTATSANTANTIVARDSSGNFSAGTITANLSGNATTATSATSATTATQVANSLTFATSGTGLSGSGSFNGSSAQTFTVTSNATSANTASTIVARDASGNFSAGTITASLSGNASTATSTGTVAASTSNGIQSAYQAAINTTTPGLGLYGIHFNGQTTADYAVGITSNGGSGTTTAAQAGIYIQGSGAYGTKMYLATTDDYASGSKTAVSIDHVGVVQTTRNYFQAAGSARAPIFYDSSDTTYYGDFAGNSKLNTLEVNGANANAPTDSTLYVSATSNNDWGITLWKASWEYGIQYNLASTHTYGLRGLKNGTEYFRIGTDLGYHSASFRAPIFYDSDDTGYYIDPNSTSNSALRMRGGALFGPNTTWGAYLAVGTNGNTNTAYASVAATNGNLHLDAASGYSMYLNYYAGSNVYFGNGASGGIYAQIANDGSFRSPIYYDYNNTGYYVDPNSSTQLRTVYADDWFRPQGDTGLYFQNYGYGLWSANAGGNLYGNVTTYGTGRNGYTGYGLGSRNTLMTNIDNGGSIIGLHDSTFGWIWRYIADDEIRFERGYSIFANSARAPIFYDSNDTSYYINPNSSSYLWSLTLSGGAYFRPNNWIQMDGNFGIYWPGYYGAHLYPTTSGSYTQLQIDGSKNSYSGMYISHSAVNGMMYDGGGNGGVYREANGRWYFYYHLGNDCMGIGSSTTNSAFNLYFSKGVFAGGRADATTFYAANNTPYYLSPGGTSYIYGAGTVNTSANVGLNIVSYGGASSGAIMHFHRSGYYAINIGLDADNVVRLGGWSSIYNRWQSDTSGNFTAAGSVTAYSDVRLKKDWVDLPDDFVERLAMVKAGTYTRIDNGERQAGCSAQDWQELLPEVVLEDAEGVLSLAYGNAAVAACVALAKSVVALRAEVQALRRH